MHSEWTPTPVNVVIAMISMIIVHIVCCQKYVLSQINVGASIHFISLQYKLISSDQSPCLKLHFNARITVLIGKVKRCSWCE